MLFFFYCVTNQLQPAMSSFKHSAALFTSTIFCFYHFVCLCPGYSSWPLLHISFCNTLPHVSSSPAFFNCLPHIHLMALSFTLPSTKERINRGSVRPGILLTRISSSSRIWLHEYVHILAHRQLV